MIPQSDITIIWRMATLLREFCQELHIIIPEATSVSTTLLSLAADEIHMNPFGYLSPIETYFSHPLLDKEYGGTDVSVPLREVLQLTSAMKPVATRVRKADSLESDQIKESSVHPLLLSAALRQQELVRMLAQNLLTLSKKNAYSEDTIAKMTAQLLTGYPSKDYPIAFFEAKALGLPVVETNEETNDLLWELVRNYLYITQPFVNSYDGSQHIEEQSVIIETVGRRTVYYKERQQALGSQKIVDTHNRWREVTMELFMHGGKESSQLHWKELQLTSMQDSDDERGHTIIPERK
jgi:hypothetical protein